MRETGSGCFPLWPAGHYCVSRVSDGNGNELMNSTETFAAWQRARLHLIISQIAPTVLLITTVALLQWGLAQTPWAVRVAALGILLASGILGALVQFQSASEAQHLARSLAGGEFDHSVQGSASWLWVPKYLTPAVFVVIYLALVIALIG